MPEVSQRFEDQERRAWNHEEDSLGKDALSLYGRAETCAVNQRGESYGWG